MSNNKKLSVDYIYLYANTLVKKCMYFFNGTGDPCSQNCLKPMEVMMQPCTQSWVLEGPSQSMANASGD